MCPAPPVDASYWVDLFPGFVGLGVGIGLSAVAVQVVAFTGVEPAVSGLAGGILETAREVGGAVGVAAVATIAIARAQHVAATDAPVGVALTAGFERATVVAAAIAVAAALTASVVLRSRQTADTVSDEPAAAADARAA